MHSLSRCSLCYGKNCSRADGYTCTDEAYRFRFKYDILVREKIENPE